MGHKSMCRYFQCPPDGHVGSTSIANFPTAMSTLCLRCLSLATLSASLHCEVGGITNSYRGKNEMQTNCHPIIRAARAKS